MDNDNKPIRCPDCNAKALWMHQDAWRFGKAEFTERALVCENSCGWHGGVAFFPWPGWQQHAKPGGDVGLNLRGELPDDPAIGLVAVERQKS